MAIKVAFIGAGSVGFCRGLFRDIVAVPAFADTQFAFHDINAKNLDMVYQLCMKDIAFNKLPATIAKTLDRRRAVAGADYVINYSRWLAYVAFAGLYAFIFDFVPRFMLKSELGPGDASLRNQLIFSFFAAPGLLHYWLDGHIWKVRSDRDLRTYLQLDRA